MKKIFYSSFMFFSIFASLSYAQDPNFRVQGNLTIDDTYRMHVGANTSDLSSPINGDIFYNSTSNKFRCYQASAWADCIGSSSSSSGGPSIGGTVTGGSDTAVLFISPAATLAQNVFELNFNGGAATPSLRIGADAPAANAQNPLIIGRDRNGATVLSVKNANAGTSARTIFQASNGTGAAYLTMYGTAYDDGSGLVDLASGIQLAGDSGVTGGMTFVLNNANANSGFRFYPGATNTLAFDITKDLNVEMGVPSSSSLRIGATPQVAQAAYPLLIGRNRNGATGTLVQNDSAGILAHSQMNLYNGTGGAYFRLYGTGFNDGFSPIDAANGMQLLGDSGLTGGVSFVLSNTNALSGFRFYPGAGTALAFEISKDGAALFKNVANATTGFQVQNAAATTIFDVDTINQRVGIGTTSPSTTLHVKGDITIGGGAIASKAIFLEPSASGTNVSTFAAQAQGADINYILPPTVGAAGTVLTDAAGTGSLTWAASTGPSIGGAITGGSDTAVLFVTPAATIAQNVSELNFNGGAVTPSLRIGANATAAIAQFPLAIGRNRNGQSGVNISNADLGAGAITHLSLSNSLASFYWFNFGTGYTTNPTDTANGAQFTADAALAGGLTFVLNNAGAGSSFRFFPGAATKALEIASNAHLLVGLATTDQGRVTIDNGASAESILVLRDNATTVFTVGDSGTIIAKNSTDSTTAYQFQNAAAAAILTIDTTNQRVGIGTAPIDANRRLTLGGTLNNDGNYLQMNQPTANERNNIEFIVAAGGYGYFGINGTSSPMTTGGAAHDFVMSSPTDNLLFATGNAPSTIKMTILASGNVDIGGTAAGNKLTVTTDGTAGTPAISLGATADSDTGEFHPAANTWAISTGGSEAARWTSTQLLLMGGASYEIDGVTTTTPTCAADGDVGRFTRYSKTSGATISICLCTKLSSVYTLTAIGTGDCT